MKTYNALYVLALLAGISNIPTNARALTPAQQKAALESAPVTQKKAGTVKWNIMLYIQARNNLAPYAGKNLRDIASNHTNKSVTVLAQWDQPRHKGAWRYKVGKESITLENYTDVKNPKDPAQKLVDFVKWGIETHPAEHYCLILWDHATGILNPPFGNPLKVLLQNKELMMNPRINLAGVLDPAVVNLDGKRRGILFDEENKTFLSNDEMRIALRKITSKKILGRRLDCIGFDACFMGMLEIAYQVRSYAKYMIGSEELELAQGWNYPALISAMMKKHHSPAEFSKLVVNSYGDHYKNRINFYTQSAVNLDKVEAIKNSLDEVVTNLHTCMKEDKLPFVRTIRRARNSCVQFSTRVYVDLHSFLTSLLEKISMEEAAPRGYEHIANLETRSDNYRGPRKMIQKKGVSKHMCQLAESLKKSISCVEKAVFANSAGANFKKAGGLSIYFPSHKLDISYKTSLFCKDSLWIDFIEKLSSI